MNQHRFVVRRIAERRRRGERARVQRGLRGPKGFSVPDSAACNDTRRAKGQRIAIRLLEGPSPALVLSIDASYHDCFHNPDCSLSGVSPRREPIRVRGAQHPTDISVLGQLVCARGSELQSELQVTYSTRSLGPSTVFAESAWAPDAPPVRHQRVRGGYLACVG